MSWKRIAVRLNIMKGMLHIAISVALVTSLFAAQARAEHEADHRYTIRGYVLDESEVPIPDVGIVVRVEDRPMGRSRTDGQGYYSVRLHLHDRDIGRKITVLAGDRSAAVAMKATRGDRSTNRLHYVNFIGADTIEGKLPGWRFPSWVYITAAVLTALVTAAVLGQRIKNHRRRRRMQDAAAHRQRASKKRPRRKKRR